MVARTCGAAQVPELPEQAEPSVSRPQEAARVTYAELTERYATNSRARRVVRQYEIAHESLQKLARWIREERHQPVFAAGIETLCKMLQHQAGRNCEHASMPVTGEVVARLPEVERR